jgi:hypothetical protein
MRASDLLGAQVLTADGRRLGLVSGLRCTPDGGGGGPVPAPRLRALVVTARGTGAALGYQQEGQRGPWLVRRVIATLHRNMAVVDLGFVDRFEPGIVHLTSGYG